jgi:L-rhamnose mutarotase
MSLKNSPAADPGYGLTYYSIFLSGPALLVYGFVTYQHEQHRTLTWITFVQGDV